ncbi:hypothetical protein GS597_12800 [Synechococcales cyanobacterium C]|uniref:Tic22 family protein n=1 Tax=Petrachloros mirabilis ULC683 TaxID=2781853 RepID=A0A8K2A8X7_9CYAN|nr:Tic22 family protein [Petrachloros mirabilis]NCJ07370.1 hypothetical protein [Petrachloros mirabilis ULC683]
MRSLIHLGLIASLTGGMIAAPALTRQHVAQALPEGRVLEQLDGVPVFAITNNNGVPILASVQDPQNQGKKLQVTPLYMDQKDAQAFVTTLKTEKPEVGGSAKVTAISLRQAYEIAQKNEGQPERLVFDFVPQQKEVDAAKTVLKQNGEQVQEFAGIPIFYAVGGEQQGFLTVEQGDQKIIPVYFRKQDLDGLLGQLKEQNPQLGASMTVKVTTLDQVIGMLMQANDPALEQVTLMPSMEAIQFAIEQQQQQAPAAAPRR